MTDGDLCGTDGHWTLLCCFNPTLELTLTNVLTVIQHLLSGTHSVGQYSKVPQ